MKNKYNIITTCDKSYFLFAKILINSILDKCNLSLIDTIFIVDTGLDDDQLDYLASRSPLISFIKTGLKTNFKEGTWGNDWQLNVRSKTTTLHNVVEKFQTPTLMLDSDMMALGDLSQLIDSGGDIQVCLRERIPPYIGSYFFALNPTKSLSFLKHWASIVQNSISQSAVESPALVEAVNHYESSSDLSIRKLPESKVNVYLPEKIQENTLLIHFKGSRLSSNINDAIQLRVFDRGWENYIKPYIK